MNKSINVIVILLMAIAFPLKAQNSQSDIQPLVQRMDSLEYELAALRLNYELTTLNFELATFTNEIYAKTLDILVDVYRRNIDYELGQIYEEYYELCRNRTIQYSGLKEIKKYFFHNMIRKYPFSESEFKSLSGSYEIIDTGYESLAKTIDRLKIVVDAYKKLM